ncbi:MAG: CYTH domain-containing protein [bacterium]|nr:CYTH domain-containing protein [bacterium]
MGTEIERKFLLADDGWRSAGGSGKLYRQGYLSTAVERNVRVRIIGDKGFLTVKGRAAGITRLEFEYEIPLADASRMLDELCFKPLIEKTRHLIEHSGLTWEVDEFAGDNAGLVVAEVELESEDQEIELPAWVGEQVTDDPRYLNSNLVEKPFTTW